MKMKKFDLEAAKAGALVQTRDGRPARIICWDKKDPKFPICEKYWFISDRFEVCFSIEDNSPISNKHFETNNYFHTEEEAEAMALKLRAVLDGAEVIEMPSGDEINSNSAEFNPFPTDSGKGTLSGYANGLHNGFSAGFNTCAEWLKSKIVK